jgi:putative YphP/YqiW family bacilliredoxin
MYPLELVAPLAKDLTEFGFVGLDSPKEVHDLLSKNEGTVLLVVNSVCGCAAANARPGAKMAITHNKKPDVLATVFAGVHKDATETAREFLLPYPPSSPAIALFKKGKLVHMLERRHIEGNTAEAIANNLMNAFEVHC